LQGCYRLLKVLPLLSGLRKQLPAPTGELDIGKLAPIFVPASFFRSGNWPGPLRLLRSPETGLTWGADGTPYSIAMMHSDGIGFSRLLFRDKLKELFPAGYRVALPELSCAFAISADATAEELQTLDPLIEGCYRNGSRQLAAGIRGCEELDAI
jgi:hypothetical protein